MTKRKRYKHLVIGDAHSNPEVSNRRFDWLANFIEHHRPDRIIDIGDWGDFDSIGKYNKGKKDAWGQSFKRDVEAYRDASKRAFGRIRSIKGYSPTLERFGGNHEEGRIDKFINDNPELSGTVSLDNLGLSDYGGRYTPFRRPKVIDGVAYCHYFYDKDSRYAIQSARAVLNKKHCSAAYGHTHIRDMAEGTRADGKRVTTLNVGCFLDPTQLMSYAGPQARERWWSGLCLLHDVSDGEFDTEFWSIDRVQRKFG
jgi:hypothetical protein